MFGACCGRISGSRLIKWGSGDSNLPSSMPLTSAWWPQREESGHIVRQRSLEGAVARRGR